MSIVDLMRRMRELGAPPEAIELAVEAIEAEQAKDAARRAKRAAQKAKERSRTKGENCDNRATIARHGGDSRSDPLPPSPNGPLSLPQTPTQSPLNPPSTRPAERDRSFYDSLEAALRKAASLENDPSPSLMDLSPILGLIDGGMSLESHILPAITAAARAGKRGRSWKFYVPIVQDAANARQHAASGVVLPAVKQPISDEMWSKAVAHFKAGSRWLFGKDSPAPGEPGCTIPSHILAAHGYAKAAA